MTRPLKLVLELPAGCPSVYERMGDHGTIGIMT